VGVIVVYTSSKKLGQTASANQVKNKVKTKAKFSSHYPMLQQIKPCNDDLFI
jgi:hypothetical protein